MLQMRFSPSLNLLLLDVQCFGKFHLSESVKQHILNINSQYFLKYLLNKIKYDLSQARPAHTCVQVCDGFQNLKVSTQTFEILSIILVI
jgi:hypothetical protein